jgi:menaquinone-dependent protoporphyrinogen IX oxidase
MGDVFGGKTIYLNQYNYKKDTNFIKLMMKINI